MCKTSGFIINSWVKVHAQSKPNQQSFSLSASLAWVGMMFAYKTDNWDEHAWMSGSRQDIHQRYTADVHGSIVSTIVSAYQSVGKTFFTRGPAGANTRSPNVVLVRGVASLVLADIRNRSPWRPPVAGCQSSRPTRYAMRWTYRIVICTIDYDALEYWQSVQITRSVTAGGSEAGRGDATETTVAAVKSAASSESDYDTVHAHNASGRTRPCGLWWSDGRQLLWRQVPAPLTTTVISCVIGSLVSSLGSS